MIPIDWSRLRPLNGSRQDAFEELCCQLAAYDIPQDAKFIRKGTPDAGVESFAILSDGNEWGWQAKFFDTMGSSQWSQLDESIEVAFHKHPKLIRYTICLPFDRPDARREDQTSMLQKWDDHVVKWKEWANAKRMEVEFVYWGTHEIIDRLSRDEHRGRVFFWFGQEFFSDTWFSKLVEESIVAASPRYTPEADVHLPIARLFDGLGRTDEFFNRIKIQLREVKSAYWWVHLESLETELEQAGRNLQETTEKLIAAVIDVQPSAIDSLPWNSIAEFAQSVYDFAEICDDKLQEAEERIHASSNKTLDKASDERVQKFRSVRSSVNRLLHKVWQFRQLIQSDEARLSTLPALLLVGEAGKGKSHLFCDIAKRRVASGLPTILLMGQRFIQDEPWSQIIKLLRLRPDTTADEFLGALEACAQVRGAKALIMIDALNEGEGKKVWKYNIAAFLQTVSHYSWISVAISVRSSYEKAIIPAELINTRLVRIQHYGFAEHEYEALRTFCNHYRIELPSVPLLVPEFQTPLFLKILCKGLYDSGVSKFPTGLRGVTSIFKLFVDSINEKLSAPEYLDYPTHRSVVWRVLDRLSGALAQSHKDHLLLEEAETIVQQIWSGSNTSRPLLRYLVEEGVLIEDQMQDGREDGFEVIRFAYERFSDHQIVKHLLDNYLDAQQPELAFAPGQPMAFLSENLGTNAGLLAAMCVQVPERIGKEFPDIMPSLAGSYAVRDGFIESLIWRDPNSISSATRELINRYLNHSDYVFERIFDVFLTVAAIPNHPYNADFLHQHLLKFEMAERDTWWSIFLYRQLGSHGAVDRIIDWAWSPEDKDHIDDESARLCGIALAWFLTTSNRFVRDRATKALVNLFTSRLRVLKIVMRQFQEVDDFYVLERLFAVAYGCVLRSLDDDEIASLAQEVYKEIFENGNPPAHILLRDYARGIIEYAIRRSLSLDIDLNKVKPPYRSEWPEIPTEEETEKYKIPYTSLDSGDKRWAQNHIHFSVMEDDFARYVIGTNNNHPDWLSLRMDEPSWRSPEEIKDDFVESLTASEKEKWDALQMACQSFSRRGEHLFAHLTDGQLQSILEMTEDSASLESQEDFPLDIPELISGEEHIWNENADQVNEIAKQLLDILSEEKKTIFEAEIIPHLKNPYRRIDKPRFDLKLAQRWILKRVFDLGWTADRFGNFDRFSADSRGRSAHKAERIGKKYQWIAYHEFLARLADNFQFREPYSEHLPKQYLGPWQIRVRDIDPSCMVRSTGRAWRSMTYAWWSSERYALWDMLIDDVEWMKETSDLPDVKSLIEVTHPQDGSRWLALNGFHIWEQPTPLEEEPFHVTHREMWYLVQGYLVHLSDIDEVFSWAVQQDFEGRWMPETRELYEVFLGEFFWSPSYTYYSHPYERTVGWQEGHFNHHMPKPIMPLTELYSNEASGFDCSVDESYTIILPSKLIIERMGLQWKGVEGSYFNSNGKLVAFDPSVKESGPGVLLVDREAFLSFLSDNNYAVLWTILGEKQLVGGGYGHDTWKGRMVLNGAYRLLNGHIEGKWTSRFSPPAHSTAK